MHKYQSFEKSKVYAQNESYFTVAVEYKKVNQRAQQIIKTGLRGDERHRSREQTRMFIVQQSAAFKIISNREETKKIKHI